MNDAKTREQLIIENERMRFTLASLLDWWDGLPNDLREELEPIAAVERARTICDAEGPPEKC